MRIFSKFWPGLLVLGLAAVVIWRIQESAAGPNLLSNPGFEDRTLAGWQIANAAGGQASASTVADQPDQTVAELTIPDAAEGSWVGLGQQLGIVPLERYRLTVRYRLVQGQSPATLVWRVSQFDHAGQSIKHEEVSIPTIPPGEPDNREASLGWNSFTHTFVTNERAARVEVGLGLLGHQATTVETDELALAVFPTWLGRVNRDPVALAAALLLLVLAGYGLGRLIWPVRRKVAVNVALAVASLGVTLIVVEIGARFIPVSLISPNWPPAYHIPYLDGKSYRLAKNYPATFVTDEAGDRHLAVSNSLGVRDVELEPLADNQEIVLVLGDSMTFGWAIDDLAKSWPRRLDGEVAKLVNGPERYHFVNAGVSGYNTFQEVMLMNTLIQDMARVGLKPKVAVISFFSRIWERNFYGPEGRFTILNGVIMYGSVKEALLHLASRLIEQGQLDDLKLISSSRIDAVHQFLLYRSRLYFVLSLLLVNRLDENWDAYPPNTDPVAVNYEVLRSFKELAQANNIQPALAYLPADNLFTPDKTTENQELVSQLTAICQELNIPFINPYNNMEQLGITGDNAKETLTLVYNRHYSAAGNLLYARALAPLIADYLNGLQESTVSAPDQK